MILNTKGMDNYFFPYVVMRCVGPARKSMAEIDRINKRIQTSDRPALCRRLQAKTASWMASDSNRVFSAVFIREGKIPRTSWATGSKDLLGMIKNDKLKYSAPTGYDVWEPGTKSRKKADRDAVKAMKARFADCNKFNAAAVLEESHDAPGAQFYTDAGNGYFSIPRVFRIRSTFYYVNRATRTTIEFANGNHECFDACCPVQFMEMIDRISPFYRQDRFDGGDK